VFHQIGARVDRFVKLPLDRLEESEILQQIRLIGQSAV
jgi:hypothetical protein